MTMLNEEDLKRNVQDKDTWVRFVYLVMFSIAFYISALLTFSISACQFLSKLFSGDIFPGLTSFGANLAEFQAQVTRYLTFTSDSKPFPFAPFPDKLSSTIVTQSNPEDKAA